ncbi:MAG: hypothetical protein ABI823_05120 [Bryobacteraceae bacterium]
MAQILVRNLSEETVDALKAQSERHKRSLQSEVAFILQREARVPRLDLLEETRKLRAQIAKRSPKQTNSVVLLREGRKR